MLIFHPALRCKHGWCPNTPCHTPSWRLAGYYVDVDSEIGEENGTRKSEEGKLFGFAFLLYLPAVSDLSTCRLFTES
jgi:hypothetical protein